MAYKKILVTASILLFTFNLQAQEIITLDTCHARALRANRGLKQAEMKVAENAELEKVALWQMLPKVTANGGYIWMEKSINLLSDEQKDRLNHLGDNLNDDIRQSLHNELDPYAPFGNSIADAIANALGSSDLNNRINAIGQEIVDGLATDTRNMGGGTVTLTQPLYMGGKLLAMHRTAQLTARLSGIELDKKQQETLLSVDQAYWQVVSLQSKKALAVKYEELLDTLENHVGQLVDAQMATKSDLAQVRVKHNEASMNLTKATNGLQLAKMLLAERCGMPLDSDFETWHNSQYGNYKDAVDRNESILQKIDSQEKHNQNRNLDSVYSHRNEMKMLRIADSIAQQGVRVAASVLKPNIVATGGYLMTNPNIFNGFSNSWGGTWMAGVVVNVPLVHPAGFHALRAAKAKREEVRWQMEEAQEMIALQVKKLDCELELAYKHLAEAESDLESADDNLLLADESFKSGICSISDLMAAQTAWMKAESEVIDAQIEVQMGRVYLNQALGK